MDMAGVQCSTGQMMLSAMQLAITANQVGWLELNGTFNTI